MAGILLAGAMRASAAPRRVSNALLNEVLKARVHGGLVDYVVLQRDRRPLDRWLDEASTVSRAEFAAWPRDARLAFLINVYNATTLRLIVDHYPVASIRKLGAWWDPKGPWHLKVVRLFGKTMTLDDLEQGMIRPDFHEPRVHFALVCAAKGCPPLRSEAYDGARLDSQLNDQERSFLAQSWKNRADAATRTAYLSPIFKWYMADFGGTKEAVLAFVKKRLAVGTDWGVSWTDYDWSLNESGK
ncbi:MAG: DUF547 domain-containing protein [Elusimicrobia bacterium]|nr:DUF547 domain-containing protein [Elusimicrobiota bacterium]